MEVDVIKFISKFVELTDEEAGIIAEFDLIRKFKQHTVLLHEGVVSNECFLVLEGCLRSFYLIDGEEKTTEFFTENQIAMPVSYHTKSPSEYFISCLEDSIVCVGTIEKTQELLRKLPKLQTIGHALNGEQAVQNKMTFDRYKTLPPEVRYLKLLEERPALCNRVSQYHIASYLGIKPETLSRIRKRIMTQK